MRLSKPHQPPTIVTLYIDECAKEVRCFRGTAELKRILEHWRGLYFKPFILERHAVYYELTQKNNNHEQHGNEQTTTTEAGGLAR